MDASERQLLIQEVIDAGRRARPGQKDWTQADVVAMLHKMRREIASDPKEAARMSALADEDLLRLFLVHLTNDPFRGAPQELREAAALLEKSKKLCYAGHYDAARDAARRCVQLAAGESGEAIRAWAVQYQGRIERDSGHMDAAMTLYEKALSLAAGLEDTYLTAVIYDQMGTVFLRSGDLDRAQEYFNMAVATDPENSDFARANLAILENLRGNTELAAAHDARAMRDFQDQGDRRNESLVMVRHARTSLEKGDHAGALRQALEGCRIASEAGNQAALDAGGYVINGAASRLLESEAGIEQLHSLLDVTWRPDEAGFQQMLHVNLAMTAKAVESFPECAYWGWLAVRQERVNGGTHLVKQFKGGFLRRGLLAGLDRGLRSLLDAAVKGRDPSSIGSAMLSLAYGRACVGDDAEALKLARAALGRFPADHEGDEPALAQRLCRDLET